MADERQLRFRRPQKGEALQRAGHAYDLRMSESIALQVAHLLTHSTTDEKAPRMDRLN